MSPLSKILRHAFPWLVFSLPILLLAYAVVMVGGTILSTLGDATGGYVLHGCGLVIVLLFAGTSISLLFLLGIDRIAQNEAESRD